MKKSVWVIEEGSYCDYRMSKDSAHAIRIVNEHRTRMIAWGEL